MSQAWTRGQLWDKIVEQAQKNPKYYDLLMSDPRQLMEKQLGMSIPGGVNIKVIEETPDTYYIVLPHFTREGAELSDADLENVAGGKGLPGLPDLGGGGLPGLPGLGGGGLPGLPGGLPGFGGSSGGGGGAAAGGGGGGASCQASGSAVGTTIVDISL
jgi:hypothetical protein